jgi:hypothetical protein
LEEQVVDLVEFSAAALRAEAESKAGCDDYGSDSYVAALEPLLYSMEHEANLNPVGRREISDRMVNALANRLTVVAWEQANPELAAAPMAKPPLIILGLPRTGTSILHETLASAPGMRTPLIWEVRDYSLVPSVQDAGADDRVKEIDAAIARKNELVPGYRAIHYEDAFIPMECLGLTVLDLVTTQFSTIAWAPAYREFLLSQDARSTYQWHRRALRYLEAARPGQQWVLKAPMHSLYMEQLLATYPDAMLVQTHRAPEAVIGSVCSLYATLRRAWSDEVPIKEQAEGDVAYTAALVQRAVDFRRSRPDVDARICDVAFTDFMSDQVGTVAHIYKHFGLELTDDARTTMADYLSDRPREKYGKHKYTLEEFGVTPDALARLFADYTEQYGSFLS